MTADEPMLFLIAGAVKGTTTAFAKVETLDELRQGVKQLGLPAVLKTVRGGYDGKGQAKISRLDDIETAWKAVGEVKCVLEAWVEFKCELSVIVARRISGSISETEVFPVTENEHECHILRRSTVPPLVPLTEPLTKRIHEIASALANAFNLSGKRQTCHHL